MARNESERRRDPFSQQVQRVTRPRRIEVVFPRVGEAAGVSLLRHNTRSLDKVALKLENILDRESEKPLSDEMYARLWGSWMVVKSGFDLIKAAEKTGRSLRETSADERNNTHPRLKERRHEALRTAMNTAVEDVLTDHTEEDLMAVAMLAAAAAVTADQVDIEMVATHLEWLRHQSIIQATSSPELAPIPHIVGGMIDVVAPVFDRTKVLFAA